MRVISGIYKRRRFDVPHSFKARPTTDFAKENLFNVLSNYMDFEDGIRALDLFAGTGSISIELVSRGCDQVISVEKDRDHYAFICKIMQELKTDKCLPIRGDVFKYLKSGREQFDFIFADPPYELAGLEVVEVDLTQVVRQEQQSGILWNATRLRQLIAEDDCYSLPKIKVSGFADIKVLPGNELIETLNSCYDHDGLDETIVVCRSNKRANIYNKGIRAQILWREDELNTGDLLMVAKNNYFWTEKEKEMDFIANGETAVVRRVRRTRELYGFRFADVTLVFPDYNDFELEVNMLLDTLHTDSPALPKAENDRLFYSVLEDYADITVKRERMKKMKADPYYNALQVKYAYAVTCHKAQGGQWKNVFLDQGYMTDEYLTPDYFRWLYTAFTRATGTLYLVNYPEEQIV